METRIIECRKIADAFLEKWPYERVVDMTLDDYVGLNDRNTFCYWVERETIKLGSIKGHPSIKFGIYKRGDKAKRPANYTSDKEYSWVAHYKTDSRKSAFGQVKTDILEIIRAARAGDFGIIDRIGLNHLMKWKIASLYSNERLLPIFKKEALWTIAERKGLQNPYKLPFSTIYKFLLDLKPESKNIYQYALELLNSYRGNDSSAFYLVGCKYEGDRDMFPMMQREEVICAGFAWEYDLAYLYGSSQEEIVKELKRLDEPSRSYSALKQFLQLKPGDIIAVKSSGNPKAGEPFLEIIAYAVVVQRDGKVYYHDDLNFGHCIQVEFIETSLSKQFSLGGYGRTIHSITDSELIDVLFDDVQHNRTVRAKIKKRRRRFRRATHNKITAPQQRKGSKPYVARMFHNEIQKLFVEHLIQLHGKDNVLMEENNVDVKLITDKKITFYEIKPYAFAEDCIRAGIGQLLTYVHLDTDNRTKEIAIVGPYKPDKEEEVLIDFLKHQLKIDFRYESFNPE